MLNDHFLATGWCGEEDGRLRYYILFSWNGTRRFQSEEGVYETRKKK